MINKIIASMILVCCFFAISLSLMGVESPIHIAPQFRVFLASCSRELDDFHIAIPNIPTIPFMKDFELGGTWYLVLLDVMVRFVSIWVNFINGLITLLNFIILAINYLIQVIQFAIIILKNLITFRDNIVVSA